MRPSAAAKAADNRAHTHKTHEVSLQASEQACEQAGSALSHLQWWTSGASGPQMSPPRQGPCVIAEDTLHIRCRGGRGFFVHNTEVGRERGTVVYVLRNALYKRITGRRNLDHRSRSPNCSAAARAFAEWRQGKGFGRFCAALAPDLPLLYLLSVPGCVRGWGTWPQGRRRPCLHLDENNVEVGGATSLHGRTVHAPRDCESRVIHKRVSLTIL